MAKREKWTQPEDLAVYDEYTNYPGRSEELINNPASFFSNAVVAAMACEAASQYDLLRRLKNAGLLRTPEEVGRRTVKVYRMRNHSVPVEEDPVEVAEFPGLTSEQVEVLTNAVDDSVYYDTEEVTE